MSTQRFGWVRLALWLCVVVGLFVVQGATAHVPGFMPYATVSGDETFAVGSVNNLDALEVDGKVRMLTVGQDTASIPDAEGVVWTLQKSDGGFTITHPTQGTYRIKLNDEDGWSVRDASDAKLYKVKNKDDKFNIYDGSDTRLLHGKMKKGAILVRTDADVEKLRIVGAVLPDSPILALPLPVELRALLWQERAGLR